ncbi:MAG: sugar transferase [Actinomycetota bacterium]
MSKRLFDLVVAGALMVLTAPLSVVSAVAVKATSPGPVLYRARRAGLGGRPFDMYKFRTMRTGLDAADRMVTEENDPRITTVGAILRRAKIDELPQLINVIKGEMSIVGPRPEDMGIVEAHYQPRHWRTLEVRPGIASYAEVRWYPDLTHHDPPPEGIAMQEWYVKRHMPIELEDSLRYIEERSLLGDVRILGRLAVLIARYAVATPPVLAVPDDPETYLANGET